jgi:hypothetical protein
MADRRTIATTFMPVRRLAGPYFATRVRTLATLGVVFLAAYGVFVAVQFAAMLGLLANYPPHRGSLTLTLPSAETVEADFVVPALLTLRETRVVQIELVRAPASARTLLFELELQAAGADTRQLGPRSVWGVTGARLTKSVRNRESGSALVGMRLRAVRLVHGRPAVVAASPYAYAHIDVWDTWGNLKNLAVGLAPFVLFWLGQRTGEAATGVAGARRKIALPDGAASERVVNAEIHQRQGPGR